MQPALLLVVVVVVLVMSLSDVAGAAAYRDARLLFEDEETRSEDCACPTTDGRTEYTQMKRYWEMQVNAEGGDRTFHELAQMVNEAGLYDDIDMNRTASLTMYNFEVSSPVKYRLKNGQILAKLTVTETYENLPTNGGSTFKILIIGDHTLNSCAYRDHFDGMYTVCCILREPDNYIDIYLMNVHFTSYQLYYSLHERIGKVLVSTTMDDLTVNDSPHDQWCHKDTGYWMNDDVTRIDTWKRAKNGRHTHYYTKDEVEKCFMDKYSSAIFTGDSHMRAMFGYIQVLRHVRGDTYVSKEETDKYAVVYSRNSMYMVSTLSDVLVENLKKIQQKVEAQEAATETSPTSRKPHLLVIDSGCHDLAFNNTAVYVSNFYKLFDVLSDMKASGLFHIIYQNIPPWPHFLEHDNDRHLNTFVNAATAYWVSEQLATLDIPIVDIHSLALPFEDTSPCGMHFICNDFPNEPKGVAGREAVQTLLRTACSF